MQQVFYSLAILACPVGMGLMMWFMMSGTKHSAKTAPETPDVNAELARLQSEINQLQAAQLDRDGVRRPA